MRMLIRICLEALAFMYILPMIGGIAFHGNFIHAIGLAIIFSLMLWGVEFLAIALGAYLTVTTMGLALLVLIPVWILGFFIFPAVALKFVADFMPNFIAVSGWEPAILGGLVLFVIGLFTGSLTAMLEGANRRSTAVA